MAVLREVSGENEAAWSSRSTRDETLQDKGDEGLPGDGKGGPLLSESLVRALAYGMVNGILLPPVSVSFAAIIFSDPAFASHLPRLVKLVMFSGGVHMACFGMLSNLKFAVGSVQDAGLIFLSAIATTVVAYSREQGLDEAEMLSTVCFTLCTCTGVLGVALVALGRMKLASLVQYLPMPVIGGYLAFIGYFCGQAGLAFASGLEIGSIQDLGKLANAESMLLITPAIAAGVVYYIFLRRYPSPITLPLLLATFLGIFFATLAAIGVDLEEARRLRLVSEASPMLPLTQAWDYFSWADVRWGALVKVCPNLLAMTIVVAFSSCLDVAAIEMEMATPLDFNGELQTVGWSNVVSGLFGGFTGSYIFSQTIFNLRAGVDTRAAGAVTCLMMVGMAASPVSVISYLPRAFFGSLLVLISADLMVEWLWQARLKMMPAEYMVCLATFVTIQVWGVEKGMLAGLVLAALSFTIAYAQVPTVMTARVKTSAVMRTFEERVILQAHRQQTVVLELQGYIFFGSAVKILSDVKQRIVWGSTVQQGNTPGSTTTGFSSFRGSVKHSSPYQRPGDASPADQTAPLSFGRNGTSDALGEVLSPVFNRSGAVYPSTPSGSDANFTTRVPAAAEGTTPRTSSRGQARHTVQDLRQQAQSRVHAVAYPGVDGSMNVEGARSRPASVSALLGGGTCASTRNGGGDSGSAASNGKRADASGSERPEEFSLIVQKRRSEGGRRVSGAEGYGAMEEGIVEDQSPDKSRKPPPGVSSPARIASITREVSFSESRAGSFGNGAVQTYMSLWANGGAGSAAEFTGGSPSICSSGGIARSRRTSSVMSLLPPHEQRTRRVILDFSNVVGVDATAARSCFLMLKIVLRTSGVNIVFSGASGKVQALLRSHGVITDQDPVFRSLDTALEWSEEVMLTERKSQALLRRVGSSSGGSLPAVTGDARIPPPLALPRPLQSVETPVGNGVADEDADEYTEDSVEEASPYLSSVEAEAAVFLGGHEDYYTRAGSLRRRSSKDSRIALAGGASPVVTGDVGSLHSILEDYLEVERYQVPESVRRVLREAGKFFKRQRVEAGAVVVDDSLPPDKLFFIGAGSVELEVPGPFGPRRLQKVCAGGTFGEVGFYLRTPQAFRAVALEPCHLHTLDREGMATMQHKNPGLCVLVQKAVMKSICLAASLSIESAQFGPVDEGRAGRLASVAEKI